MRIYFSKCLVGLWMTAFSFCLSTTNVQSSESKIALVIGNTQYQELPSLKNATNDAASMARALSKKGFTVFFTQDADTEDLRKALVFVSEQAATADQILIYYAGHSVVRNGAAELLGVESKGMAQSTSPLAITTTDILKYFEYPFAQKAIILDACLEFTTDRYEGGTQNLNLPHALGLETLLVFATSIGQVAYDGKGAHSIFTGSILDNMVKGEIDLQSAIQKVRKDVITTSRTHQIPVSISTLTHPYFLMTDKFDAKLLSTKSGLIQSYSSSGYANKPLLDQISMGMNPKGF
jgi:uncharacterized caspase-like protein